MMIDTYFKTSYEKTLIAPLLKFFESKNLNPNVITALGLSFGIAILPMLAIGYTHIALTCLLVSGYLDTLDGTLARQKNISTPRGAILDIVSDRIVEFAIVLGLYLVDPESRSLWCILMLGSILICVTTFLVVGIFIENTAEKGFHYSPGLMERAEAFFFFACMIYFPALFPMLAFLFVSLVCLTAIIRIWQFRKQNR